MGGREKDYLYRSWHISNQRQHAVQTECGGELWQDRLWDQVYQCLAVAQRKPKLATIRDRVPATYRPAWPTTSTSGPQHHQEYRPCLITHRSCFDYRCFGWRWLRNNATGSTEAQWSYGARRMICRETWPRFGRRRSHSSWIRRPKSVLHRMHDTLKNILVLVVLIGLSALYYSRWYTQYVVAQQLNSVGALI